MPPAECKICNLSFADLKTLHGHLRSHKVRIEEYYPKYFPRFDLYTKEPIKFKNIEFYFHTLFNLRENLVSYFKEHPTDRTNLIECLRLRKELKNLSGAPSTSYARSCICPTPILCEKFGYDYNELAKVAGLNPIFDYKQKLEFAGGDIEILQDTREQKGLNFKNAKVTETTVNFGDYVCKTNFNGLAVDRKSLADYCGSLSKGFERLQRECVRAKEAGGYLIFCVEEPLTHVEKIPFMPHTKKIKATPEFLFSRMRDLLHEFDHIQFLFVSGRIQMAATIEKIFRLKNDPRTVDFQYFVDKGQI